MCLLNQVEELKETVKEEFMPWVSQYLVMKRVSIEPNFHSLYSNFLDTLKNPEFNKMVLNETYRNIKVNFAVFFSYLLKSRPCTQIQLTQNALILNLCFLSFPFVKKSLFYTYLALTRESQCGVVI